MTEYDAFGNPVDQPPLDAASFGAAEPAGPTVGPAGGDAAPVAGPVPGRPAEPTPPLTAASYVPTSYSVRRRNPVGIVALLLMIAIPGIVGYVIYRQVDGAVDSVRKGFDSFSTLSETHSTSGSGSSGGPAPEGLDGRSMFRPEHMAAGLRELRRVARGGRPVFVRVEAQRVDVQVIRDGRAQLVQRTWDGEARTIGTATESAGAPTMRWSQIDPEAPRRLYEAVRDGSTRPSKQLTYAAMFASARRWSAFRADGASFTAPASGFDVRRTGG